MKKIKLLFLVAMLVPMVSIAQLVISDPGLYSVIDFSNTVAGVNVGEYNGSGFMNEPTTGFLDADAWEIRGMSDLSGIKDFGVEATTGDYARGIGNGNVTTGGLYAFSPSTVCLGFEATESDMTPGSITLKVQNNTGADVNSFMITYVVWTLNNGNRSNNFNFSWSIDNVTFIDDEEHLFTTLADSAVVPNWQGFNKIIRANITIPNGGFIYFRWSTDDVGGADNRDQIALDDIVIDFNPDAIEVCLPISVFPWSEDFESYSDANDLLNYCWQSKYGILSSQTMFSDWDYTNYFYFSSFANTGDKSLAVNLYNEYAADWMISPQFDLGDGSVNYVLSFDIALTNYDAASQGVFEVDDYYAVLISTDGGINWNPLNTLMSINSENDGIPALGTHYLVDLGAYTGLVKIAFYAESTVNDGHDIEIFIDNLSVSELSGCLEPYDVQPEIISGSSVLLSWQSVNPGAEFSLEYGDFGFTPGSGTLLNNLDTQEYLITGLSEGEYEFYIQSVCSPTESSLWIGPFSFNLTQGSDCITAFNYGLINDAASFNTIESSGFHWYTVTLDQDYDEVLFSTCNSDFDTKINVYSDCSNQIGYNDDDDYSLCTNDLNSTVYYESLPAGIYYVMVYGYDSNEFGDYTLEVSSDNSIPIITASGLNFYESNDNDGAIANAIILTLENDEFTNVGNLMTEGVDYAVSYVPASMTFQVLVLSESQVMLSYSGYADSHSTLDNASFDFNFFDNAYVGNNGNAVINNYLYLNIFYTDFVLSSDLALTEPSSGYNCDLNETTQVPYMVENTGTATITAGTAFTLYLESESVVLLNENLVVEEDMAPGSSQFGFTTNTVDLSAIGAVVYKAYIDYEHDANQDNDTINGFIVHFDQVISFPADDDMNDTIITGSFPFVVSAEVTYTPDSAYLSPEWQWLAGSTTNELSVNEEGWYTLILNTDGCYTEDSVYIKLFVGRTSVFDETSISIYPNPNQGRFIIEISSAEIENAKIEILSIDGKLIHSEEINCNTTLSKEFDISSYSSGLYFVKISSGNKSYNQRIVKQ